ncbi:hypothetical protein N7481_003772 [Penicillium waksmanii]|uniref:uncharacterized protein n=1 Tax=Penicillium waksmanii TaxID=69791 RepID=UPI0025468B65|nr:uncharacterized protein N7481_003772 [Penicillium waksmanii]KAJ5988562.1 hypothetical protein N7481_003772 [Penicillium waksmanii]
MTYNISTGRLDSDEETEYLSDRDNSPVHVLRPMNEDEDIHHRDWSYTPPRSRRRGRGLTVHRPERSLSHDRSRKFYTDSRDPEGSIYPTSVERPSRSVHWKHPAPASSETKDLAPETGEKSDSSIKSQKNTFDTVLCSADEAKDITVHLDLGASLDLSDELSHLSRLNRLGHFKAGISFFESRLAQHMDFFPVVAEYADLLQQQGAFGNMSRFVHTRCHDSSVSYSHNEMTLLKLLECVANIHTKGALLPALEMAKSVLGQSEELDDGSNQENLSRYRSHSLPKTTSQHLSEDVQMKKSTEKSKFGPEGSFRIQKCSWFHSSIGMRV